MATGKIMRRNFAIKIGSSKEVRAKVEDKSSVFARSTSEILNSCLQNSYKKKEYQNNFWNELTQTKVASPREENRGPLRSMRSVLNSTKPTPLPVASAGSQLMNGPLTGAVKRAFEPNDQSTDDEAVRTRQRSAVATLAANRRLLKSSNGYKIFSTRRFGSSASSSCGSLFRRHDDRRRVSSFKRTIGGGFIERLYTTTQVTNDVKSCTGLNNISSSKYLISLRNQNIPAPLGSVSQAVQVSSVIQQELMPIDKSLRERISLKNTYAAKISSDAKDADPMSGWHHPPSPDILSTRTSDRIPERRTYVISTTDKDGQDGRMRTTNRKRRLEMTCKPLPDSTTTTASSVANKKLPIPQQQTATVPPCETSTTEEGGQPRNMMHMTARRMPNVEQPVRRFSLRRPPTTNLTEITPPAPGPAAESLIQQQNRSNNSITSRTSTLSSIAFNPSQSRYSRFNNRPY